MQETQKIQRIKMVQTMHEIPTKQRMPGFQKVNLPRMQRRQTLHEMRNFQKMQMLQRMQKLQE